MLKAVLWFLVSFQKQDNNNQMDRAALSVLFLEFRNRNNPKTNQGEELKVTPSPLITLLFIFAIVAAALHTDLLTILLTASEIRQNNCLFKDL